MMKLVPKDDKLAQEAYIKGVMFIFMGALWGTKGTEYARGVIESQLRCMECEDELPNTEVIDA
ncbi:MAG: hypothetical protein IPM06_21250 [Rhizobiales bacterium]|nr:hypothetical protein [Hyphomicrobiales bacterium]